MEQKQLAAAAKSSPNQKLELTAREKLVITGVEEIISSANTQVQIKTLCGNLTVTGSDLKIDNFVIGDKNLELTGNIDEIKFGKTKKSFLKRILK